MNKKQALEAAKLWINAPVNKKWESTQESAKLFKCNILPGCTPERTPFVDAMHGQILTSGDLGRSKVVLLGKGVLWDGGGYNAKTFYDDVHDMHADMAGAAICGAVKASVKSETVATALPVAMNFFSGHPTRGGLLPGGVYRTLSGKTVEVVDTDAEGRLLLADAIEVVCDIGKPKIIITVGTLAGCADMGPAWGSYTTNSNSLRRKFQKALALSEERFMELPLDLDQREYLQGTRSDLMNTPVTDKGLTRSGHAFTPALFLHEFIPASVRWIHLDIAGPTLDTDRLATGFGFETLHTFILALINIGET